MAVTIDETKARENREKVSDQTWYDVDARLSIFLDLLFGIHDENPEANASLTLVTQGATISGNVVSVVKYEQDQASTVEEASPKMAEALRLLIKNWEDVRADRKNSDEDERPMQLRTFAHFSEATVFSGSNRFELKDLRVDLKDVTAWTIGSMS